MKNFTWGLVVASFVVALGCGGSDNGGTAVDEDTGLAADSSAGDGLAEVLTDTGTDTGSDTGATDSSMGGDGDATMCTSPKTLCGSGAGVRPLARSAA